MEGVVRGDKTALEYIMADEFTITGLTNWEESESKAEWIITALKIAGRLKEGGFNFDRSRIRIYDNTALVNSSLTLKGLMGDKPIEMKYLILDFWIKREGRWQVAARHQERSPVISDERCIEVHSCDESFEASDPSCLPGASYALHPSRSRSMPA